MSKSPDASKFHMPGIGIDTLVASEQKNFEALAEAYRTTVEGAQAVLRYQLELGRRAADEFSITVCDFVRPSGSLEDRVAKQGGYSKQAMEKGLSSARELGELMTKASAEALNLPKRVTESFDEVRDFAKESIAAN